MQGSSQESFFAQLRRLSVTVDRQVSDLQAAVNQTPRNPPQEGAAVLLLGNLQAEVKKLKADAKTELQSLHSDGGFLQLVPVCQELLQQQSQQMDKVEAYLKQYGYVPPATSQASGQDGASVDADKSSNDPTSETEEVTALSQGECSTPETTQQTRCRRYSDDRTPTLEDFGLRGDFMKRIVAINSNKEEPPPKGPTQAADAVFKMPPVPSSISSSSGVIPSTPAGWGLQGQSDLDDPFSQGEICVTPGILGGKSLPEVTPLSFRDGVYERSGEVVHQESIALQPLCLDSQCFDEPTLTLQHQPAQSLKTQALSPKRTFTIDSTGSESGSPIPPMLQTPGVKQIAKPTIHKPQVLLSESKDNDSPILPMLQTPGIKQIAKPTIQKPQVLPSESKDNDSPIPPMLQTPGIKQVAKPTIQEAQVAPSVDDGREACGELSPIPPILTNKGLYPPIQKQDNQSLERELKRVGDNSEKNSPIPPELMTPGISLAPKNTDGLVPTRPQLTKSDSAENSPIVPELQVLRVQSSNYKSQASSSLKLSQVVLSRDLDPDEDEPLPAPPELTVNLKELTLQMSSYSKSESSSQDPLPQQKADMSGQANSSTFISSQYQSHSTGGSTHSSQEGHSMVDTFTGDKENFPPSGVPGARVKFVTEEEYASQPTYVQRKLSLQFINNSIDKINCILASHEANGLDAELHEGDLRNDLAAWTRPMILAMVKLRRLQQVRGRGADTVYAPLH